MKKYLFLIFSSLALFAADYPIDEICFGQYIAKEFSQNEPKHVNSHPTQKLPALQVYISASVPKEVWRRLANEVQAHGGAFILRGPIENSLYKTEQLKKELDIPIFIGNAPFDQYNIQRVPTLLCDSGEEVRMVVGTNAEIADVLP